MKTHYTLRTITLIAGGLFVLTPGPLMAAPSPTPSQASAEDPYRLGQRYFNGQGVAQNEAKAFELFQQAAKQGNADALTFIGVCYASGRGVPADDRVARETFEKALEQGSQIAGTNLAVFLIRGRGGEKDVARGLTLLERSAAKNNLQSALILGEIYFDGIHNDGKPDYEKAYNILWPAAEQGDPAAQNFLGIMLKNGHLGPNRLVESRIWLERSAFQSNGKACFNLAELWNPRSSDPNARIEALRWLLIGSELHEVFASRLVEEIRPTFDPAEFHAAEVLAQLTLETIQRKHSTTSP